MQGSKERTQFRSTTSDSRQVSSATLYGDRRGVKLEFHGTDTDTNTDTDIRDAPIV